MIINLDEKTYNEVLDILSVKKAPYAQKGEFDLWTYEGGIQLMKMKYTRDEGFLSTHTFKLPAPKVTDTKEYLTFYHEWSMWALAMDSFLGERPQPPITFIK